MINEQQREPRNQHLSEFHLDKCLRTHDYRHALINLQTNPNIIIYICILNVSKDSYIYLWSQTCMGHILPLDHQLTFIHLLSWAGIKKSCHTRASIDHPTDQNSSAGELILELHTRREQNTYLC